MKTFKALAIFIVGFAVGGSFLSAHSENLPEYLISNSNPHLVQKTFQSIESEVGDISIVETNPYFIGVKIDHNSPTTYAGGACLKIRQGERRAFRSGKPFVRRLSRNCERNVLYRKLNTPNDTLLAQQWHLNRIGAFEAWDKTVGSRQVIVATVDTGTNLDLADLWENLWTNPDEIVGNGIDDDHNGVIDDIFGYNAWANSGNPWDSDGHGTAVASVLGSVGNDSLGMCGTAWRTKILSVRISDNQGNMNLSSIIKGIDYVTQVKTTKNLNLKAINASWGGYSYSSQLYSAIQRAQNAGILLIAAAGNEVNNNDSHPMYPASFNLSNIISTAATDELGQLASFSNYGSSTVDIAAPGSNIVAIYKNPQDQYFAYYFVSGSSFSAPIVSGLVSLLGSYSANLTAAQIRDAVLNGAAFRSSLSGKVATSGEVNLNSSLAIVPYDPIETPSPTPQATPTIPRTPVIQPTSTPSPSLILNPTPTAPRVCNLSGKLRRTKKSLSSSKMPDPFSFEFVLKVESSDNSIRMRKRLGKGKKFNVRVPCDKRYYFSVASRTKGLHQAVAVQSPYVYEAFANQEFTIYTYTMHK